MLDQDGRGRFLRPRAEPRVRPLDAQDRGQLPGDPNTGAAIAFRCHSRSLRPRAQPRRCTSASSSASASTWTTVRLVNRSSGGPGSDPVP